MHYKLDTVIKFGKYKELELTVEEMIQHDPDYLDWMMREFKDATWDDEIGHAMSRHLDRTT